MGDPNPPAGLLLSLLPIYLRPYPAYHALIKSRGSHKVLYIGERERAREREREESYYK